ncbi:hypothetical protein QJS04_geneDACA001632 [Acorus gramineus]|uniref:J domain-containing protein n=1 Tax=Acorus gramineus TaxID=55184 RepID=A0AAV9BG26_ACOGR|nr:hypothetical protein QJS04_geneDACA001632 [Acorus gramineus]
MGHKNHPLRTSDHTTMALSANRDTQLWRNPLHRTSHHHQLSTASPPDLGEDGLNAYQVLEVSETSSSAEIKASFRRLAKETHPDLSGSRGVPGDAASRRFLRVLAAYEILSDSKKRAHYDSFLLSRIRNQSVEGVVTHKFYSSVAITEDQEVVEWLGWYRFAIKEIALHDKVAEGTGYLNTIENEFYAAIRMAYYGPFVESMDLLPDCFEAEERSACETAEVLHLVSGRDLFGIVRLVDRVPELPNVRFEQLSSSDCVGSVEHSQSPVFPSSKQQVKYQTDFVSDVYGNLELHISGRVVATATRTPPKRLCHGNDKTGSQDLIHVFLSSSRDYSQSLSASEAGSRILLGTISGLGTSADEGSCFVCDRSGTKTHVILKHRTLLVKHMHWYPVGGEVSACECRCRRAQLPPSKFWLFEPRCGMHDIGGWYVETFGRDTKGRTVPSQRRWDGFYAVEQTEKRLHPAVYLLALAYRTLDLEDTKRKQQTVRDFIKPKLSNMLRWCKKIL